MPFLRCVFATNSATANLESTPLAGLKQPATQVPVYQATWRTGTAGGE
jgi:hypothetical protein